MFLLIVVIASGLYITLFFQYGYEASYESVLRMERHPIQRLIRALHRYSSAALVVTTVVHGWRIFVAGRFTPRRRRWRWMTGVATLLVVWPAGVTGYLLVWDVRAGAIAEAVGRTVGFFGGGVALWVRHLSVSDTASGSTFMVIVWLAHLGLTAVVGWFAFRHLRGSKLAWLPSRHWMLAMGGALVAVSLLVPVGMLDPYKGGRVGENLPLDPFVLFLLPILDSGWRWLGLAALTVAATVAATVPFILGRRSVGEPAAVTVVEQACTGCNLCVLDCPYDALSLAAGTGDREVAVVDEEACTSCAICLGSCVFGALTFGPVTAGGPEGDEPEPLIPDLDITRGSGDGRPVVVACDRHAAEIGRTATAPVQLVRCAGAVGPDLVRMLTESGATSIEIVGCAVDDCRYGIGNTLADDRIGGDRAPHVPRARKAMVHSRWLAPGELDGLTGAPSVGSNPVLTGDPRDADDPGVTGDGDRHAAAGSRTQRALIGSSLVVVASMLATALATEAPFDGTSDDSAAVRVVVDQDPTLGLASDEGFTEPVETIEVRLDGESLGSRATSRWRSAVVAVEDWSVEPGRRLVEVVAIGPTEKQIVFSEQIDLAVNQRLHVPVRSVTLAPVAEVGRQVFLDRQSGCAVCHSVEPGENQIGPSLYGVATRAETRVEGLDAATYLWQSILLPDEYVVEGYPAGQMLPIYQDRLSQEELDALLAYLLTLTVSSTTGDDS